MATRGITSSGHESGWVGRTVSTTSPAGSRNNMIVNISDSQTLAVTAEKHVPLVFIDSMCFQRALFSQEKATADALAAQASEVVRAPARQLV